MTTAPPPLSARRLRTLRLRARIALLIVALATLASLTPPTSLRAAPPAQGAPSQSMIYLPLLAGGAGGGEQPSSIDLIDRALAAGQISADTAALYRVFALFADGRLPAAYRGDDSAIYAGAVLGGVIDQLAGLAPATRAEIEPFLTPPDEPGSWYSRPQLAEGAALAQAEPEWRYLPHPTHPLTVVFDRRVPRHEELANLVFVEAANTIWPNLTELMDREPRSYSSRLPGRFIIYLVDRAPRAVATRGCERSQSHVLFNPANYERAELAALMMEAILYSYDLLRDCEEYRWLRTATAIWAADRVYPGDQYEHKFAARWLDSTHFPLNEPDRIGGESGPQSWRGDRQAGSYLLPFYMARELKRPELMREIWANAFQFTSLQAVNASLPGNFAQQWPLFASRNWNRGPERQYQSYDRLTVGAYENGQVLKLDGQPARKVELLSDVRYLAARYHRLVIGDPKISTITLENPFARGDWPTAKVALWVRISGSDVWTPREDVTSQRMKSFCLDLRRERVAEMMVLVTNSEWRDTSHVLEPATPLQLHLSNVGCRAWSGTVNYTSEYEDPTGARRERHVTNVTFERAASPFVLREGELPGVFFRPRPGAGEVNFSGWYWEENQTPTRCNWNLSGPFAIEPRISYLYLGASTYRGYGGEGHFARDSLVEGRDSCGEEIGFDYSDANRWWQAYDTVEEAGRLVIDPGGRRISGRYQDGSGTYTWTFLAASPE